MTEVLSTGDARVVLREHHLHYVAELSVDRKLLSCRFAAGCATARCTGACCSSGVLLDVSHRDRILAEAELVLRYIEPAQEHDPSRWFNADDQRDDDFESGVACSTATVGDGCVFLDSQRRCVLHLAEAESPGLKPFYCRAFPIAIDRGVLIVDDENCPEEKHCCGPHAGGELTIVDVCAGELEFVLGARGFDELRRAASASHSSSKAEPNESAVA